MDVLRFETHPTLRRPFLVMAFAGWGDAGDAATTAVRVLAAQLNATRFASIDPEEFYDFTVMRPHVRLVDGATRQIHWMSNDFSAALLPGAERDVILGLGPEPHLRWKTFGRAVIDFARHCGVETIVTLGAFLAEVLYSRPVQVSGFATDPALVEHLGLTPTRYEGPTGIVGVLGGMCRDEGIPAVSLWAALPHYITASPNPRGALALLGKVSAVLGFRLELTELEEAAAAFEAKINEAVSGDPKLAAYVREIKKREFVH